MAFIDEISFHLRAGHGGNGVVRWLHEKGKEWAGAAGGDGGNGGDVYARAVRDVGILVKYRNKKEFSAENGVHGMKKSMFGRNGDDFYLDLPIGSIITKVNTKTDASSVEESRWELLREGETVLLLKGGRGGLGNEHFKASTNTTPWEHTDGKPGEEGDFDIELQLIVDAGLAGFPNAGKSSLLNVITNADAKVGSYQFTTLEPNLGAFHGYILADIPGLIEGASEGRGLGHKFLRHIARTKIILHCISIENLKELGGEGIASAYTTIRNEISAYGADHPEQNLTDKPEIIVLTKTDMADEKMLVKAMKEAHKLIKLPKDSPIQSAQSAQSIQEEVLSVSIYDDASIKRLSDSLVKILRSMEQ
jgi:GTP-binding protein